MKHASSRARKDDLNAHSTAWGRLSSALNRRVSTPDCRTSSETFSGVLTIFVGMIARGASIDTTISSALAFKRTPQSLPSGLTRGTTRIRRAHAARNRRSPRILGFFPALNVCGRRQRDPLLAGQVREPGSHPAHRFAGSHLGSRAIGLRRDQGSRRLSGRHRRCFA